MKNQHISDKISDPLHIITALRDSDPYIEAIYTQGSCFRFHLFLKSIYPDAQPFTNLMRSHVVSKIGELFYDIRGVVDGNFELMTKNELDEARKWSFASHNLLKITSCPACDEPIGV